MIHLRKKQLFVTIIFILLWSHHATSELSSQNLMSKAKLMILFIVDGLRPDLINEIDTPNIHQLIKGGVFFEKSHAVFPTVTRVNAAAIATGSYPSKNGIVSNNMYLSLLNPTTSFSTGDYFNLYKLDILTNGKLLSCKTWAQRLSEKGIFPIAISSGSTGSAFLLNHWAIKDVGVLINPSFELDSIVAFPEVVNNQILKKFIQPSKLSLTTNFNEKVNWTIQVFTDYVLTTLSPNVIYCWMTEPDHTQHEYGIGAPQTIETIQNSDRNIGLVIDKIKQMGFYEETNILIVSAHGFSTNIYGINVEEELIKARLKNPQNQMMLF
jgi:predicted AlkP superfamily pyrophosphatase or phosphodiesterase